MLYRILTEDKNIVGIRKLLGQYLSGATIYQGQGLWQGQWENCLIIESDDLETIEVAKLLAGAIKELNEQDAVLIQEIDCESYMI